MALDFDFPYTSYTNSVSEQIEASPTKKTRPVVVEKTEEVAQKELKKRVSYRAATPPLLKQVSPLPAPEQDSLLQKYVAASTTEQSPSELRLEVLQGHLSCIERLHQEQIAKYSQLNARLDGLSQLKQRLHGDMCSSDDCVDWSTCEMRQGMLQECIEMGLVVPKGKKGDLQWDKDELSLFLENITETSTRYAGAQNPVNMMITQLMASREVLTKVITGILKSHREMGNEVARALHS